MFRSHVQMFNFSILFNINLDGRGYSRAIESNWGENHSNQNFRGEIEKWVKIQDSKV